jgi:hypothetical protein
MCESNLLLHMILRRCAVAVEDSPGALYSGCMDVPKKVERTWRLLFRRLSEWLTDPWISLVIELITTLVRAHSTRCDGLFENLAYESTLDLHDASGQSATVRKQQRLRLLQNDITAFEDIAYGEGNTLAAYAVTPGRAVYVYQDGDRWHVLISLRSAKNFGDEITFCVERQIEDGFTQNEEWWQIELRHSTRWLRLSINFPTTRHCHSATLQRRSTREAVLLGPDHFSMQPDGRQRLVWECGAVRPLEIFTVRWQW